MGDRPRALVKAQDSLTFLSLLPAHLLGKGPVFIETRDGIPAVW